MKCGRLLPRAFELPKKYHPKDNKYTDEFVGGMFKYEGLNTCYSFSNVHKNHDGDL